MKHYLEIVCDMEKRKNELHFCPGIYNFIKSNTLINNYKTEMTAQELI